MPDVLQFLSLRKRAYKLAQKSWLNDEALADLVNFAHLREPSPLGERERDILIGRQEVVWRILNHLHASEQDLFTIYDAIGARNARSRSN